MEQLILDIAATKETSAMVADGSIEQAVARHDGELDKLRLFMGRLPAGVLVMEEVKRKEAMAQRGTQVWDVLKWLAAGLLGAVLSWYGRLYLTGN